MREIKLRARKATGEWAYFTLDQVLRHNGVPAWVYEYPTIEKQLWTGQHDKNGKEVYEWDIVGWWSCEYLGEEGHENHDPECQCEEGIVEWDPDKARFCVRQHDYLYTIPYNRPIEVIGNLHEHPHLLK